MKFGIVVFPGSNCDRDMQDALSSDLGQETIMLWHKTKDLSMFREEDCIILPGGFSYGDYLRCGAIARFSPLMKEVIRFAENGGKVFGVCNGFQILCEAGLLPGALLRNEQQKFICKSIYLKPEGMYKDLMNHADGQPPIFQIPIAHGEGRFHAGETDLDELEANGQILFRYCNENGDITNHANPNGSLRNIAGICNEHRNIFGMMPHPERACSPVLGYEDGKKILRSLLMEVQPAI